MFTSSWIPQRRKRRLETSNQNSILKVKNMRKKTTIEISFKLRDKLKEMGKKGETYEKIIEKLIENQK